MSDHIDRQQLLEKNLTIPKALFGNENNGKLLLIGDGTYIYINKSSNFLFQRLSYSLHKFQNLLKHRYILDVMGPYAATKTDAQIMGDIMNDGQHPLHWLLRTNDALKPR
ncbi:hypothetical protein PYW08_006130 [Mythimna loreyi]|uniref:Uncharacterized protein n=1 Tax=Mythimna loreyi TaxID=667449 RepID=A0ACC2QM94_9NEOP|nr:hypothetical protein PYW08_006130 [Mythimna loreyi]